MGMSQKNDTCKKYGFNSLVTGSTDSAAIEAYYDEWAETYDETLKEWDYRTPAEASATLCTYLRPGANILDIGCGTGMFAKAMHSKLECRIEGIDISTASLEVAEKQGHYQNLQHHDLHSIPLPVGNDAFDAATCIGVLTYIEDAKDLLVDLCRVVRPEGYVLFTQRNDRWAENNFSKATNDLHSRRLWEILDVSEAKPYLPKNREFSDSILVIQVVCRVLS
tara:strand:+ start:300 stop:965 length:666 start_codon:yes stop_codon:yes gene_type:complete